MNRKNNKEGRFNLPSTFKFSVCIILFIVLFFFVEPITVLEAESYPERNFLKSFKLDKDSYIGIIYTHSVEKTETSEWYSYEKGKLILMEERFNSQGAGLPTDSPYKFEKTDNGYRFYDIEEPFEEVIYRTGQVIANHKLNIDGDVILFKDFSTPGEAVNFKIKNISIAKYLWRCIN